MTPAPPHDPAAGERGNGTFGRKLAAASSLTAAAAIEQESGRSDRFQPHDQLLDGLLERLLRGERTCSVSGTALKATLHLEDLSPTDREFMTEIYTLERMEKRGAWFVPEQVNLRVGVLQFPFHVRTNPRFMVWAIADEAVKVFSKSSPDALASWSLFEPAARLFYRPLERSGFFTTPKGYSEVVESWPEDRATLDWLGFDVGRLDPEVPAVVRPAGEQVSQRQAIVAVLGEQAGKPLASRYRLLQLTEMARRYYAKADRHGRALRRRVMAKELQPALCGCFGGDWLAFLDYLGEEAHPDEDVVTTLPKKQPLMGAKPDERVTVGATSDAVLVDETGAVLLGGGPAVSLVDERLAVLKRYWVEFDKLHAGQDRGMASLWGLVDETGDFVSSSSGAIAQYNPARYFHLLPSELLADVDRLWGRTVLALAPSRIVMAVSPHQLMAEAFGPALKFWHGVGLTAWFLTQGSFSRTDLDGIRDYHAREVDAMSELEAAPPEDLFHELSRANRLLGPPEPIEDRSTLVDAGGLTLTVSMSSGTRRSGFEMLRDLITKYRRAWAADKLDTYLRAAREGEIGHAVHTYRRTEADRGKPPTIKQFAKHVVGPANHWFGADISLLFASFGEESPVQSEVVQGGVDRVRLSRAAFRGFGGKEVPSEGYENPNWVPGRLANSALSYLQLEQALGRPPTLKEFGPSTIEWAARQTKSDPDKTWTWYTQVIAWAVLNQ
jgi:hypothetical protein